MIDFVDGVSLVEELIIALPIVMFMRTRSPHFPSADLPIIFYRLPVLNWARQQLAIWHDFIIYNVLLFGDC